MIYGLLVVVVALAVVVGLQFRAIDRSRASARADNRQLWHTVVCHIEQQQLADPRTATPAKRKIVEDFWNGTLDLIGAAHCT